NLEYPPPDAFSVGGKKPLDVEAVNRKPAVVAEAPTNRRCSAKASEANPSGRRTVLRAIPPGPQPSAYRAGHSMSRHADRRLPYHSKPAARQRGRERWMPLAPQGASQSFPDFWGLNVFASQVPLQPVQVEKPGRPVITGLLHDRYRRVIVFPVLVPAFVRNKDRFLEVYFGHK